MRFIVLAVMVLALIALLWDRSVVYKDQKNFEGNRKPSVLLDDVYEVLLDLVEGKAQPPVKERTKAMCDNGEPAEGYQSKRNMVTKHYITRGVEC